MYSVFLRMYPSYSTDGNFYMQAASFRVFFLATGGIKVSYNGESINQRSQ